MDGVGPAHAARRVRWGHDFRGCGELLAGMASASIRWPRRCGGTRNRAPPDKTVGHAAHGCGGPCVETLRKRAFLGMALSAEAPPSVSDVRGVMMRVPRGCEGTRSRPSCGIISERVLAGAEEPPEKTTSPMTHGRVPRGCGGTCLAASQPFDQRVLAGTEDPRPRRTGGRGVSLAVRMSLLQAGARDGAARVPRGCGGPPITWYWSRSIRARSSRVRRTLGKAHEHSTADPAS